MRILVYGMSGFVGGIETFIYNHVTQIMKNDENIKFDFLSNADKMAFEDELIEKGCNVWHIVERSRDYFKFKKDSKKFFEDNKGVYDVFWFNNCMLVNIEYLKLAKKAGIKKIILHSHNSNNMSAFSLKGYIMGAMHSMNRKKACSIATDHWACSDYAAEWLFTKEITQKSAYTFIPNAINTDKFKYDENTRIIKRKELNLEDKLVVGYVGRFTYQKNTEFLIDIFNEVQKKKENSRLLLIGEGPLEDSMNQKAIEYGISDKVINLGFRSDVPELLQAMDVFLLPSRFEGLPVVAVEAQAAGLVCVVAGDGISGQTKITEEFHFMKLEQSAEEWAFKICGSNNDRKDTVETMKLKGFELVQAAENLAKKLCD